jgi:hypothetical protein
VDVNAVMEEADLAQFFTEEGPMEPAATQEEVVSS